MTAIDECVAALLYYEIERERGNYDGYPYAKETLRKIGAKP